MQAFRQKRALRAAVSAQVNTGKIVNQSNEKTSVFDSSDETRSSVTTDSLRDEKNGQESIIVGWDGPEDLLNPRNWSMSRRIVIFAILWINVFAVDWASPADSQVDKSIEKAFHVSDEAEALSPSLYTFGLAVGAIAAGPISETVGRLPVYVYSRILHFAWLIGAALAPNFGAQCVFRLFAGLSGSILLAIHAASVADIFGPVYRTVAWPIIALASFWGTAFSPLVGAWISQTKTDWRWAEWIAVILSGSTLILTLLFLPETFAPILLSWRAKLLRELTGCQRFQGEMETQKIFLERLKLNALRALHMVTREPIVALLGGWLVIEYLVVFGFLHGFKYIFEKTYGFSTGIAGTAGYVALSVGVTLWTCLVPLYYKLYKEKVAKLHEQVTGEKSPNYAIISSQIPGTDLPDPEYRLWMALLAAPALPISLFWLGWTNYKFISPWSSIIAVVLLGFSWAGIYVTVYQYILDVYGIYAGSALAIITCWRYLMSGAVNLFSSPMYEGIGVHWSMTWLGILALLQMPLPIIFYYYGPQIRKKSAFAGRYSRPDNPRERIGRAGQWR